jgi:hypothetical protein
MYSKMLKQSEAWEVEEIITIFYKKNIDNIYVINLYCLFLSKKLEFDKSINILNRNLLIIKSKLLEDTKKIILEEQYNIINLNK